VTSETDIDEVVQTRTVFENVSKGILAKAEHLRKVFGTTDELVICTKVRLRAQFTACIRKCDAAEKTRRGPFVCLESASSTMSVMPACSGLLRTCCEKFKLTLEGGAQILEEGQVQVSDKERAAQLEQLFRDVVNVLVEKCVNSDTMRPYPAAMIDKSLRDLHFSVDVTRSAKVQALEAIAKLQSILPIRRALMRLRVQVRTRCLPRVRPSWSALSLPRRLHRRRFPAEYGQGLSKCSGRFGVCGVCSLVSIKAKHHIRRRGAF
jgi:ribosome maturation protein Sdo1